MTLSIANSFEQSLNRFLDWREISVPLEMGHKLVCFLQEKRGRNVGIYDINANIFRLGKNGCVIWQIQRDEQFRFFWENNHRIAISRGQDGARDPFMNLIVVAATTNTKKLSPIDKVKAFCFAVPIKARILSTSLNGFDYEIDLERGVAINITPLPRA